MTHAKSNPTPGDPPKVPAAAYVRMSTEHQQYSTDNQMDVIRDYAAKNGFEIVRVYSDDGKSGLNVRGRDSFSQMISDVQQGRADYLFILVYDVNQRARWRSGSRRASRPTAWCWFPAPTTSRPTCDGSTM